MSPRAESRGLKGKNMDKKLKSRLLPFVLTIVVVALDQITKMLVVRYIKPYTIGFTMWNGYFRIIHVSNTGVAFSMGATWGETIRHFMFILIPIVVIGIVIGIYMRSDDLTKIQRWAIAGIIGGGIGNLIDRCFRAEGVVDFLDFKFWGLFGLERWPTFNVADSAVIVCGNILIISFIIAAVKESKEKKEAK